MKFLALYFLSNSKGKACAKFRPIALFTIILLFQIIGCSTKLNATLAPFTPTVLPLIAVYEVMPTRYELSKNTISVSIEFKSIKFTKRTHKFLDSRRIQLVAHFRNVSSNSIVFRKPIKYGFLGVNVCLNDLEFMIEMKDGPSMNVTGNSNYPCGHEHSVFPEITLDDFITLEAGDTFSYPLEVTPPGVLIKETKYIGNLPPGTYKLKVEYSNLDIGYELPLEVTPTASFGNWQAELEWYDNHTMVVDLNAWVGHTVSNEVELTIPAE